MVPEQRNGSSKSRRPSRKRNRRSRRDSGRQKRRFKRGIYLLPGFFTVSNLFFGFLSIISTMHCLAWPGGDAPGPWSLSYSALFIGIAALLDALDGRVARLAKATSQFGEEFDSLADIVLGPAVPGAGGLAHRFYLSRLQCRATGPLQYPGRFRVC